MKEIYIPFYRPYGMSEEEYEYEVRLAEERAAEQAFNEEIEREYYERQPKEGESDGSI